MINKKKPISLIALLKESNEERGYREWIYDIKI